eukprot:TCONS_00040128-protein
MAAHCILCNKEDEQDNLVQVKQKGLKTLKKLAKERKLEDLSSELKKQPLYVHHDCRRKFIDKRRSSGGNEPCRKRLRSSVDSEDQFKWKIHCFFCGKEKDHKNSTSDVETIPILNNILKQCEVRDDDWGNLVRNRLLPSIDIVADEGFYHRSCIAKFFKESRSDKSAGRPVNNNMQKHFEHICDWLEGESECEPH